MNHFAELNRRLPSSKKFFDSMRLTAGEITIKFYRRRDQSPSTKSHLTWLRDYTTPSVYPFYPYRHQRQLVYFGKGGRIICASYAEDYMEDHETWIHDFMSAMELGGKKFFEYGCRDEMAPVKRELHSDVDLFKAIECSANHTMRPDYDELKTLVTTILKYPPKFD